MLEVNKSPPGYGADGGTAHQTTDRALMGLLTGQWQTAIDGITDHPGTTDHPWRHAALPARPEYSEFPENSGWSCQAVVLSPACHTRRRGNS